MASKKDITSPKVGMNTDKAVFDRTKTEYGFAFNANFTDAHGNGQANLQNEPSNVYCTGFKSGYKVIGHKYDVNSDRTYFFLTNPTTGKSEIGYISTLQNFEGASVTSDCTECGIEVTLETPLEDQTQTAMCDYTTIITDLCKDTSDLSSCLNFSVDYPIHESNIEIKTEKTGVNMYFNDGLNPRRYLQLDNLAMYLLDTDECTGVETEACLKCDELRVDKLFKKPCVITNTIQNGGGLRAGTYEVTVAYSTSTGDEISNYYSKTNPVSIHDSNNNILDQTNLDYLTNQAISIGISDLDGSYDYFKVAVIYKSGLDTATRVFNYGVYPIDTESITISSLADKPTVDISDLFSRKPFYITAKGLATGNGYLFHYGMTAHREINLQPVVSLMGLYVKWITVSARERLYNDGADVSNYRSYMRDEVTPLSLQFFGEGGYESALFNFIPRPATESELEVLGAGFTDNNSTSSILEHVNDCAENIRDKRWQFQNTATIDGICDAYTSAPSSNITIDETHECIVDVDTIATGTILIDLGVESLSDYINGNTATILADTTGEWTDVQNIIDDPTDYTEFCTPSVEANCTTPALVSEVIEAVSTSTEVTIVSPQPSGSYVKPNSPSSCNAISSLLTEDTSFRDTYMRSTDTVYDRVATGFNVTCALATQAITFNPPPIAQIDSPTHLDYAGAITSASFVVSSMPSSAVSADFNANIHNNALWYEVDFNGQDYVVFEVSAISTPTIDALHSNQLRLTVYSNCSSPTDLAAYSRIISDLTLVNDPQKLITLAAADFGGTASTAYIAIDSTIGEDVEFTMTAATTAVSSTIALTGTSGTANITYSVTGYTATFNVNLTTTANDFVALHAAAILGTYSVTVTAAAGVLTFTGPAVLVATSITNLTGDLAGTITEASFDVGIDGNTYPTPFNGTLNGTMDDFVTLHAANLITSSNVLVEKTATNTLVFRSTVTQYGTLIPPSAGVSVIVTLDQTYYVLHAPGGCINVYQRTVEVVPSVQFTNLTFLKRQVYTTSCLSNIPDGMECEPIPHRFGEFSHWESSLKYPCNSELYDSSTLTIHEEDIPFGMQARFEANYVDSISINGDYILNTEANFMDKNIRHYKFPCSSIVPFMSTSAENPGPFNDSTIYPIGFELDPEVIRTFLDIAVNNGLITLEERTRLKRYEVFRGDRTTDKSIIAKGLLFDMWEYPESNGDTAYYSNYPLNTLGTDQLNGNITHRRASLGNNMFTFHSPDTHHNRPTLPNEMNIEGYQFGNAASYFDTVKDHPTHTVLGNSAFQLANTLAIAEVALSTLTTTSEWAVNSTTGGISTPVGVIAAGIAISALVLTAPIQVGEKRYQWITTLRNLGQPQQFGYYQACVGHYNYFLPNTDVDNSLRGLPITQYLREGRVDVADEQNATSLSINNVDREESVFIGLGETVAHNLIYPTTYTNYDTTYIGDSSRHRYSGTGRSERFIRRAASPYVSLKQYLPEQYGGIYSVDWISTGFCGDIDAETTCNPIFGGDTFISRFSVKRKFRFFTEDAHGLAPNTPFKYSDYFNVNPSVETNRFFLDYLINEDSDNTTALSTIFPSDRSHYLLDSLTNASDFYVKPPSKFYLYSYGFPHFLTESPINSNFRYAKRELHENFYPNFGDVLNNTQESRVSIREPNTFFYNDVYSLTPTRVPTRTLPIDYSRDLYDKLNDLENTTVYSLQDNSEQTLTDPWLVYRPLDAYQFPTSYGQLIDMDGIESEQILGRFENGITVFGAIDQIADRFTSTTGNLGSGGIFSGRNINFNSTDLGYAGTQHISKVSNEFGHFWPDVKRGEIFLLSPNGKGLTQITEGKEMWFKEHLPFKILKHVTGLENSDLDNNYKGLGITMGWDSRTKRVFLTKRDYRPIVTGVTYEDKKFIFDGVEVQLTDTDVFEDCSFTLAYSPISKRWISYYGFIPEYYVSYENYFQTGKNVSTDESELGLWSHPPFIDSYQVFYGKLSPFIVESELPTKFTNSTLNDIEYWLDVRKYYNKYDFSDIVGSGFDEVIVYNSFQNTGQLNLVSQNTNDMTQLLDYPKHNTSSIDILQIEIAGKYSFNYLYNSIRNESSRAPHWLYDCSQVNKSLVNGQFDYEYTYKDRLRGDYFSVRLSNKSESRYKMIFRLLSDKREFTEN